MSIVNAAGLQTVNNMLEAKKSAVGNPNKMFQAILEEKLGPVSMSETTSSYNSSAVKSSSGDGMSYSNLADYYSNGLYDNSLYGSGLSGWDRLVYGSYPNYLAAIAAANGTLSGDSTYDAYISEASAEYGVPKNLIKAVISCESSFNPNAVSSSGAVGLMQLMPATARSLGVTNSYDPRQNIMGGTKYLSSLIKNFDGDLILAMAGYNMGGNRVKNLGITPNSPNESAYDSIPSGVMSYAKKVISKMAQYGG